MAKRNPHLIPQADAQVGGEGGGWFGCDLRGNPPSPSSVTLDVSHACMYPDLYQRYGWIQDAAADAVVMLFQYCKTMRYLVLGITAMGEDSLRNIRIQEEYEHCPTPVYKCDSSSPTQWLDEAEEQELQARCASCHS